MNPVFITTRYDKVCKFPNRERPKSKSVWLNENSVCIVFDEISETRYPMSYVMWSDSLTGATGFGWILNTSLRSIHLI